LLRERVRSTGAHAPLGGIERSGWKLVYNDKPNLLIEAVGKLVKFSDFSYSLGFTVAEDGKLDDVVVGSPAYQAGIGPGMGLRAVDGRKWSPAVLRDALKASQSGSQSIELLLENAQFFKTYSVSYHLGDQNPHLERVSDQPDILGEVLKPLSR
jgi:predicted metalloprotease with PDZ domain